MAVFDQFWDEFTNAFSRLPVWLPGSAVELGDIGTMERGGWNKLTTLKELNIDFDTAAVQSNVSYSYASGNDVDVTATANAETGQLAPGTEVTAGMKMSFKRGGAFVVRAENCQHSRIDNLLKVEDRIQSAGVSDDGWRSRRWVLVSEVVTAQPAIVIVAAHAGAEATVEIMGTGGIPELAKIAAGTGSIRLTHESALDARTLSVERVPLMWRGRRRRGWPLSGWRDLGETVAPVEAAEIPTDADKFVDFEPAAADIPEPTESE